MKRSQIKNKNLRIKKGRPSAKLGNVFDRHVKLEFEDKDVESTMKTMVKEPYVHHIPIMTGGVGYDGVYNFYKNDFVGKMPEDTKIIRVSRTVGRNQVVDELILSFTHDIEIKSIIPGIEPTGRYVELPHVVVMKFKGNKIEHEHIYWDQASLLTQLGLLDPKTLPVKGIEQLQQLKELSRI
ncbi:MAG: ester cyclase [Nitrososphaeraceae archaeon]|jgi:carboxymethylenebutenolidase